MMSIHVITDNGPQFVARDFGEFIRNMITDVRCDDAGPVMTTWNE